MLYLLAYLYHFFLPGLLLAYLLNLRRLTYLLAFSISYVLLVLNLLALQYAGAPVHWFAWLVNLQVTILFLLVLCKALAGSRRLSGGFQDFLGPAARAFRPCVRLLERRAGSALIASALFLLLVGYVLYAGPYTEVPADAWAHLARFQAQCEVLRGGRFAPNTSLAALLFSQGDHWYFLHAYLCDLSGIAIAQSMLPLTVATTLTFLFGVFFMGMLCFARMRLSRLTATLMAAAATLFCMAHMGVSVFSYIRYYAFAPAILNFVIALAALAVYWNWLEARGFGFAALGLLPLFSLAMAVVHTQEFVLSFFMSLVITLVVFCRTVLNPGRERHARQVSISSTSARGKHVLMRVMVAFIGLVAVYTALFFYYRGSRPVNMNYAWLVVPVGNWIPLFRHMLVLNPGQSFCAALTAWGGFVYLLFILRIKRFWSNAYFTGGMLLPLVTVFNPMTVDMALRYSPSAITVLYRTGYVIPLYFVAGYLFVDAVKNLAGAPCLAFPSFGKARWRGCGRMVNTLIVAGLLVLLFPSDDSSRSSAWGSRALTLRPVPPENNYGQWNDLIGYLNSLTRRKIITDPVTGYVLNGLTPHDSATEKFYLSTVRLRVAGDGWEVLDLRRDITSGPDSDWLLVLNERDGGLSETGRISGHWPERILKVSDYWSPELKAYVNAHPEYFRKIWERNRIEVYDIEEEAVKAALPTVPVLVSATPMLFEGPGIRLDWTDVRPEGFVAYHVQCSEDGVHWQDINTRREYRYSWINHQGKPTDVFGNWTWCLPSNKTHYYRVRALYRSGPGPWSNIEKATVHKYR